MRVIRSRSPVVLFRFEKQSRKSDAMRYAGQDTILLFFAQRFFSTNRRRARSPKKEKRTR